jgi:hypothetical protein
MAVTGNARMRGGVLDRNITPKNHLDRMARIEEIPGHPWEGVQGYTLAELQSIERMLKSEVAHLNAGLASGDLQMARRVAIAIKHKRDEQLAAVRAIRQIRFPHGSPVDTGGRAKREARAKVWHLARMFHRWAQTQREEDWDEVLDAYADAPKEELERMPQGEG